MSVVCLSVAALTAAGGSVDGGDDVGEELAATTTVFLLWLLSTANYLRKKKLVRVEARYSRCGTPGLAHALRHQEVGRSGTGVGGGCTSTVDRLTVTGASEVTSVKHL